MSKLEELVPPLELCKLIPEGEFEDSCFAWSYPSDKRKTEPFVDYREYIEFCRRNIVNSPDVCPAPTLEEIMAKLPPCACVSDYLGWVASSHYIGNNFPKFASNGATATLKLWLKLKGIEHGK